MTTAHRSFAVRQADVRDIPRLAQHRAAIFRDMGRLAPHLEAAMERATAAFLREVFPRGDYLAWIAEDAGMPAIVGGAMVQLRPVLPRPEREGLDLGPEAIVLNVYVEPRWRRRGIAEALMRAVLRFLDTRGIHRIVLHASDEGRPLYERLGFQPTNEMRLVDRRLAITSS